METKLKNRFSTIDEYIALQPKEVRAGLKQLRQVIKKAAPQAQEVISYQMPAFRMHRILIWFAAAKNHYGLYPYSKTIQVFKNKLKTYRLSKGTLRLPLDKPIPVKLITDIVKYNVKEISNKMPLRRASKKRSNT